MHKEIKSSLDFISSQETIRKTANPATMMTAKFAAKAAESRTKVLNEPKKFTVKCDIWIESCCELWYLETVDGRQ